MTDAELGGRKLDGRKPPSLVPGVALLIAAAALMVVTLVDPPMPDWARTTVAIAAIAVVIALLVYAVVVFRTSTKRGSRG